MSSEIVTIPGPPPPAATDLDPPSRSELLTEMNAALRKQVGKIAKWFASQTKNNTLARWKLGRVIVNIRAHPEKYGPKSYRQLTEFFPHSKDIILTSALLFERYTLAQLRNDMKLTNTNGEPLYWSHINLLITVVNEEQRNALKEATLANSWTPDQLANEIRRRRDPTKTPGSSKRGKPPLRPKSFTGVIEQCFSESNRWLKVKDTVWNNEDVNIRTMFEAASPQELTSNTAKKLRQLAEVLSDLATSSNSMAADFTKMARQLETRWGKGAAKATAGAGAD